LRNSTPGSSKLKPMWRHSEACSVRWLSDIFSSSVHRTGIETQRSLLGLCEDVLVFIRLGSHSLLVASHIAFVPTWTTMTVVLLSYFSCWRSNALLMLLVAGRL
jgi:hypothetical protein